MELFNLLRIFVVGLFWVPSVVSDNSLTNGFLDSHLTNVVSSFELLLVGKVRLTELEVQLPQELALIHFKEIYRVRNIYNLVVILNYEGNNTNLAEGLRSAIQSQCSSSINKNGAVIIIISREENLNLIELLNILTSEPQVQCLDLSSELFVIPYKNLENLISAKNSISSILTIFEVYNIKNKIVFNTFQVQHFPQHFDLLLQELKRKVVRRTNLRGVRVIGVSELKPGLVEADSNGKISFLGGYNVEEYRCLRDSLNFVEGTVPWKGYIGLSSDGSLTGMGQQVNDGEADISIQSQEILPYRGQRLTFLIHNLNNIEKLFAFFQQRQTISQENIFIQTFSVSAWTASIVTWASLAVSILAIHKLSINLQSHNSEESCSIVRHVWIWGLATICQKGWHALPNTTPLRIIVLIGLLSSSIFYQAFCASLVSLLSVPSVLVHSFSDILKYDFVIYAEKDTNAAISLVEGLKYGNSTRTKLALSANEGLAKILTSKSAIISPVYLFYPKVDSNIYPPSFLCKHVSKEDARHSSTKSGMFIKKDSPYKELFYYKLMQMAESGIRHRLSKRYRVDGVQLNCLAEDIKLPRDSINLNEVASAFVVLIFAIPASTSILLFEILRRKSNTAV